MTPQRDDRPGDADPHVRGEGLHRLWNELRLHRAWVDRTVVLGFALLTGLVVVAFTHLTEAAIDAFRAIAGGGGLATWLPLVWTPALTVAVVWLTRRLAPGAVGSGVPQVVRALDDASLTDAQRRWCVSPLLAVQKVALVTGGLLAGLSIGREGPTVQVGAGIMSGARRWLSRHATIDEHDLMVAGAAAGIAAAFNTPLGGIVFGLEQLTRRRGITHSTLVIAATVLAGLVAISVFGNQAYFGRLAVQSFGWEIFAPGLAVALASGLLGGLFVKLVVASLTGEHRINDWRRRHPYWFAAGCAVVVAIIGIATGLSTAGAGYAPTRALLEGQADDVPLLYTAAKFVATWLSAWTGAPAGLFSPSLAIGAGIGHDVSHWFGLPRDAAIPLIALGMVGFLSATTQGPITAFIIVMEMVAGNTMVLSLMACAMVASGVSRLIAKPMYDQLARALPLPRA